MVGLWLWAAGPGRDVKMMKVLTFCALFAAGLAAADGAVYESDFIVSEPELPPPPEPFPPPPSPEPLPPVPKQPLPLRSPKGAEKAESEPGQPSKGGGRGGGFVKAGKGGGVPRGLFMEKKGGISGYRQAADGSVPSAERSRYYGLIASRFRRACQACGLEASPTGKSPVYSVRFGKGGAVPEIVLTKTSGSDAFDMEVLRALRTVRSVPGLPEAFIRAYPILQLQINVH